MESYFSRKPAAWICTLELRSLRQQLHTMPTTSDTRNEQVANARSWFLETLYTGLTRADSVQPVDLIFVMAGRMNRKQYGLELYRKGVAPKLVLSVGRFEVSKMLQTEFAFADELAALCSVTPPYQRHFFFSLDQFGTRVELASVPQWNTYGEVVGLMRHLEREHAAKVMVVSTDIHLQRVAYTIRKESLQRTPLEQRRTSGGKGGSLPEIHSAALRRQSRGQCERNSTPSTRCVQICSK